MLIPKLLEKNFPTNFFNMRFFQFLSSNFAISVKFCVFGTSIDLLQPLVFFTRIWESFPKDRIKFIRNKQEFNVELKNYFWQNLKETVACNRLFCPSYYR